MTINTSNSRLNKIAWLNKQKAVDNFSKLQLQKFLFFYEMFQYADEKKYDFYSLKAYKNGPVFSNFYGDTVYREDEVKNYISSVEDVIDIDEENARVSKFLIETMTDSELSKLTHEFNMWKVHQKQIAQNIKQIPMNEEDITEEDKEILSFIKISEPDYDYQILKLGEKRFVFSKDDFNQLSDGHLELLDSLSNSEELINPVYVELDSDGRLLID